MLLPVSNMMSILYFASFFLFVSNESSQVSEEVSILFGWIDRLNVHIFCDLWQMLVHLEENVRYFSGDRRRERERERKKEYSSPYPKSRDFVTKYSSTSIWNQLTTFRRSNFSSAFFSLLCSWSLFCVICCLFLSFTPFTFDDIKCHSEWSDSSAEHSMTQNNLKQKMRQKELKQIKLPHVNETFFLDISE